jgi:hypothetical protein
VELVLALFTTLIDQVGPDEKAVASREGDFQWKMEWRAREDSNL